MELSYVKYCFNDIVNEIPIWSWKEILYATDNNIIKSENVIDYAIKIIDENILGYDFVMELAILNRNEDVSKNLIELTLLEDYESDEEIKSKWLYALLNHIYINKNKYEDALDIVEQIYSDFAYPMEISGFVRYMPMDDGGDLGSCKLNEARLYDKWKKYLEENRKKYL